MINDNVLSDRLNLYREGKTEETPKGEIINESIESTISNFLAIVFNIIEVGIVFARSLAFGYAAKTIFVTDWNFLGLIAVGFSTEIIITNIFNLFKQKNK